MTQVSTTKANQTLLSRLGSLGRYLWRVISCDGYYVAIIAIAALALRFLASYQNSFWVDEIVMIQVGWGSTQQVLDFIIEDTAHGPLYWVLTQLLTRVSETELWMRLLPMLAGTLSMYYAYFFLRDTLGRRAGLIGAVLLCLNVNAIAYSADARLYSFLILFALAAVHHYQRALTTGALRHYVLFGVATLLGIYNSHFAFFLGLVLGVHLVGSALVHWLGKSKQPRWLSRHIWIALSGIAALVLYLPWLPVMLSFFTGPWGIVGGNYIGGVASGGSASGVYIQVSEAFGIGSTMNPGIGIYWMIYPVLFVLMLLALKRGASNRILLVLWLLLPLQVLMSVQARHYFTTRYFMIIFPPLLLGAACGLDRIWSFITWLRNRFIRKNKADTKTAFRRSAPIITAIIVVVVSLPFIANALRLPQQSWKGAANYIRHNAKPGDIVQLGSGDEIGLLYYLDVDELGLSVESRDSAVPWICAGDRDIWVVSHYYTNRPENFRKWIEGKMELVKVLPGRMVSILILRYHRNAPVVTNPQRGWWPYLAPPELHAAGLPPFDPNDPIPSLTIPADDFLAIGWLDNLGGCMASVLNFAGEPKLRDLHLNAQSVNGDEIEHQTDFETGLREKWLVWYESATEQIEVQMENGAYPAHLQYVSLFPVESLLDSEGLSMGMHQVWRKTIFAEEEGLLQITMRISRGDAEKLALRVDGEPMEIEQLPEVMLYRVEVPLRWGTHIIDLCPSTRIDIDWMLVNLADRKYCDFTSPTAVETLHVDQLPQGSYLVYAQVRSDGNAVLPTPGWIEVRDLKRGVILSRILLSARSGGNNPGERFPSWSCDFLQAGYAMLTATGEDLVSDCYGAFKTLRGDLEISLHQFDPDSLELASLTIIPFREDEEIQRLIESDMMNSEEPAPAFETNIGMMVELNGEAVWRVEGTGQKECLAWGKSFDLLDGVYQIEADLTDPTAGNYIFDELTTVQRFIAQRVGENKLFTVVNGFLVIEPRITWLGEGDLTFRGMRITQLEGSIDPGSLQKEFLEKYKNIKGSDFQISDIEELAWEKAIKLY